MNIHIKRLLFGLLALPVVVVLYPLLLVLFIPVWIIAEIISSVYALGKEFI